MSYRPLTCASSAAVEARFLDRNVERSSVFLALLNAPEDGERRLRHTERENYRVDAMNAMRQAVLGAQRVPQIPSEGLTMDLKTRLITLEGSSNFRDIGGYPSNSGRTVRWGIVYRSGALLRLTASDWEWMSARRIAVVCDLRSREERELAPTHWQGANLPQHVGGAYDAAQLIGRNGTIEEHNAGVGEMDEQLYSLFLEILSLSFTEIFRALAHAHTPIIVHCTAGQDRTGLAIGLLLKILGVPDDVIFEDYVLSSECRRPENELDRAKLFERRHDNIMARYFYDAYQARGAAAYLPRPLINKNGRPFLAKTLEKIAARWSSVEDFLLSTTALNRDDLDRVRANCRE